MTKVVHCKKEPYDVYIGRPSKWGNPFSHIIDKETLAEYVVADRESAVNFYEAYLIKQILSGKISREEVLELDGKTLGCWCHPQYCHGDAIVRVINMIKLGEI